MRNRFILALVLVLGAMFNTAQAATQYLVGDSVTYEYDDVANAAALALFGTPTIDGDTVEFLPPNFRAESLNGAGLDYVDASFVFSRVYSHGGDDIQSIRVTEYGDYGLLNGDWVDVGLTLEAESLIDGSDTASDTDSFGDSGNAGFGNWEISAEINPAAAFLNGASDMTVTITDVLQAYTDSTGEAAWIQKKLAFTASTVVPVPAAAWLFGSALVGLGLVRRRG